MKGIVFTEFLELVETKFGFEVVDEIIEKSELESNGVYTSVGTYAFSEMVQLLTHLSNHTKLSIDDLLYVYGTHFFKVLENSYGSILSSYSGPIELLNSIESHIHVHVRKIYPGAELPRFEVLEKAADKMTMMYFSDRAMYSFAKALMENAFNHYGEKASVEMKKIKEDGTQVQFDIKKV